jgi:UDP-N-acetylmuramoyl-L-alanyl-D-glutamate--2,6-diaminopimelate ligase
MKKRTRTVFYGLKNPADCFAVLMSDSLKGVDFLLNINDELANVKLKLVGMHNVYNALAAASCAKELDVSMGDIERGLNSLEKVNGRLEQVGEYNGGEIFVDFAHTPDGLEKSLIALKKYCKGRLVCVFGCGGNRDKEKRPLMGTVVSTWADFCYLTSDNPRDEEPTQIIAEIEKGINDKFFDWIVIPNRTHAITIALKGLKHGDVLLVAGKGGEEYQEIKGIKYPYKDEDVIKEFIKKD